MHPAFSIIVFTTVSGLGYGLAAVLGLGVLDPAATPTRIAHVVALALIAAGLLSSTLHLGNPQRAWRALTQWRSSWLSREGVLALATFLPLLCSAWASVIDGRYLALPGLLGVAGCVATVYCTGMIYGSLRSIQAWNTPLTPLSFLLIAAAGGATLASVARLAGGGNGALLAMAAIIALLAAGAAKLAWRRRMLTAAPLSTPESATGLGGLGKVRLFEAPHVGDNYLTREMGFKVARKHARKLAAIAALLGVVVPVLLLVGSLAASARPILAVSLAILAALAHLVGVLVERWLFFAEARHAVTNYYR